MAPIGRLRATDAERGRCARTNPFPELRELAEIGFDRFHSAQGLERHSHPGLFALCYIIGGSVRFIAGEQECELHGGDAFCAWPGEELRGVDDMIQPLHALLAAATHVEAAAETLPRSAGGRGRPAPQPSLAPAPPERLPLPRKCTSC